MTPSMEITTQRAGLIIPIRTIIKLSTIRKTKCSGKTSKKKLDMKRVSGSTPLRLKPNKPLKMLWERRNINNLLPNLIPQKNQKKPLKLMSPSMKPPIPAKRFTIRLKVKFNITQNQNPVKNLMKQRPIML